MTMLHTLPAAVGRPPIRRIQEADLGWALAEGWKDFREKRGDVLVLALIYPLIGLGAAVLAFNGQILPLLFPLIAGLTILGPAVASGFYEIARRRDAGLDASWLHFLDPLRRESRASLAILTAGLAILFVLWLAAAWLIYSAIMGAGPAPGMADFLRQLFTTPQGWGVIVVGNLVGLAFAIATLALSVVSFPLVIDKPVDPVTAAETSVRAFSENAVVMAHWGVRVALLLALGCLPAFLGLTVVLPVLGYATWHLYTRIISR